MNWFRPFLSQFLYGTVSQFFQGVFRSENAFLLSVFADLGMKVLDRIWRVDKPSTLLIIFKIR